jgi:hypothetical protein
LSRRGYDGTDRYDRRHRPRARKSGMKSGGGYVSLPIGIGNLPKEPVIRSSGRRDCGQRRNWSGRPTRWKKGRRRGARPALNSRKNTPRFANCPERPPNRSTSSSSNQTRWGLHHQSADARPCRHHRRDLSDGLLHQRLDDLRLLRRPGRRRGPRPLSAPPSEQGENAIRRRKAVV